MMEWKWRGKLRENAPWSKGGSWICRGFSKEMVEMMWMIGAQTRAAHTHGGKFARRGTVVEIRRAKLGNVEMSWNSCGN